jgi:cytochrome c oxidase subunit IV
MAHEDSSLSPQERHAAHVKKIWKVAGILAIATIIEFVFAFALPIEDFKFLRIWIFILLTIVKAFYIVAEFMHLKGEVKSLMWSVLLPMIFVVWLLVAMLVEGSTIFDIRF